MRPGRTPTCTGSATISPRAGATSPTPIPTTDAGLARGHKIYQDFCLGCHGPVGDGMGPAQPWIYPPPLNFTILKNREICGGILYYQIMNGITGTAMPYFKRELESEKIWDVGNYVAVYFINEAMPIPSRGALTRRMNPWKNDKLKINNVK